MILIDEKPIFDEIYDLLEKQSQERGGFTFLKKLKELTIGSGDRSFRVSKDGLWLGNAVFGSAPFRVDMDGNIICSAITISGGAITLGTNAWHIDSSGNMWWGNYANYASAVNKISATGSIFGSAIDSTSVEADIFKTNSGAVQKIQISNAGTTIIIQDSTPTTVFEANGETFTNGIVELNTANNNARCLYINTSYVNATATTAYFLNDSAQDCEVLKLETTVGTNNATILVTTGTGATWHAEFGGSVKIGGELEINNSSKVSLDINSSYAGGSIRINETATTTTSAMMALESARPCSGMEIVLPHSTNIQTGLVVSYGGTGTAGIGVIHCIAYKASNSATCLGLQQHTTGKSHINFSGDPDNSSPTDGDLWFDGSELKLRIGGTTYKLDKTSV